MNSTLFKLNFKDLARGLFSAIFAAVVVAVFSTLNGIFSVPGFDVFSVDWAEVYRNIVNVAVVAAEGAFMGYIGKRFFSDAEGKLLGKF